MTCVHGTARLMSTSQSDAWHPGQNLGPLKLALVSCGVDRNAWPRPEHLFEFSGHTQSKYRRLRWIAHTD